MPQQECFELLACLQTSSNRILSGAGQIANGLVTRIRNPHGNQVARASQTRQSDRITSIRLDALGGRSRDATGGDHLAAKAFGQELPCQRISARARLVDHLQRAGRAVITQSLTNVFEVWAHGTDKVRHLAVIAGGCNSDGVLVDIQSNVRSDTLMHGLPPFCG